MTPQEIRNERLAETLIHNLHRRHIQGFYCPTAAEAVQKVSQLIEDGSSVTWGGTMTVRDIGIPGYLRNRRTLEVLDRDLATTPEQKQAIYLKAFTADVYLTSANAISEDGVIVNIDGNGNRVAAITWGPKKVIFVIGLNKVAQMSRLLLPVLAARQRPSMPQGSTSQLPATSMARAITAIPHRRSATTFTSSATLPMVATSSCW